MRWWWRTSFIVAAGVLLDCLISWLTTCNPKYHDTSHCTLFGGPLLSFLASSIVVSWTFLGANEHQLVAGFTIVLAISTVLLWLSTRSLWIATSGLVAFAEQQAKDMKASIAAVTDSANAAVTANQIAVTNSERQLRAYVTAQEVNVVTHRNIGRMGGYGDMVPGNPHTYEFSIMLKNGGATPAINGRINISSDKFNGGMPETFSFPDSSTFGYALIGPQTVWRTPSIRIAAAELENPAVPTDRFLWGWIEYDDIFSGSIRHRTEFCFKIIFERLPVTNDPWLGFEPHSRFNAADAGCLRPIDPHTNRSS
jgi:hypothetical protein